MVDGCVFVVIARLILVRGCVLLSFVGFLSSYFGVCLGFNGWIAIGHVLDFNFGVP